MSRYIGPKCKLCRREGVKLFLKGEKCESPKCPLIVRQSPPGGHGKKRRQKFSDFKLQLREKQKTKRIYSVNERQFKNYFVEAKKSSLNTGEALLSLLERRIDNLVYRLGLVASRAQARQRITHGDLFVNGKIAKTPSYQVRLGDKLSWRSLALTADKVRPDWISLDKLKKQATVQALPKRDQIPEGINEQLIVEFYSR